MLASLIPDARLVPLSSANHTLLEDEPAWAQFLDEIDQFVRGEELQSADTPPARRAASAANSGVSEQLEKRRLDAADLLSGLDSLDVSRYRVVGAYTRYSASARNALADGKQRILAGLESPTGRRENHLVWAAPGSGKTFFAQQIAETHPGEVPF